MTCLAVPAQKTARILRFDEPARELGRVAEVDGQVKLRFEYTNIDSRPVTIVDVHTQCGCLKPTFSTKPVAAGERGVVEAVFDPKGRFGDFSIGLTVVATNGEWSKYNTLTVKGYVISVVPEEEIRWPYALDGRLRGDVNAIGMRQLTRKSPVRDRSIKIFNATDKPMTLRYESGDRRVTVSGPDRIGPRAEAEVVYLLDPREMPVGSFAVESKIIADGVAVTVPVKGLIVE